MIQLSDILGTQTTRCYEDAHSKKKVLEVLSELFAAVDPDLSSTEIFDCLIARERLGSTGLGKGVALPHGRMKNGQRTHAAFVRTVDPIDYDALDRQPVDLFLGLMVPEESTEEHLAMLASIAEKFNNETLRERLRNATNEVEILRLLADDPAQNPA